MKKAVILTLAISLYAGLFPADEGRSAEPAYQQLLKMRGVSESPMTAMPLSSRAWLKNIPADACVFDGHTGRPVTAQAVMDRVQRSQVVYAGEQHDKLSHHQAQLKVLQAVYVRLLKALQRSQHQLAGGFEMLYTTHQSALDRYMAGGSAEDFQTEVDWPRTWGFPFDLYRPLFEFLRSNKLKALGLNVPNPIVRKVRRQGLESLTPQERQFIPSDMQQTQDPAYLGLLQEIYHQHGSNPSNPTDLRRFLDSQTLWNEGMAGQVAAYVRDNPEAGVVVFAGALHAYDAAMPEGVKRRIPSIRQTEVILTSDASCPSELSAEDLVLRADFVWVLPQ